MSEAMIPTETDETFTVTVVSSDVVSADREAWETLEKFLGVDPVEAWKLVEMTHAPERHPQTGALTGNVVSTGIWKRDQSVETPPNLNLASVTAPAEDSTEDEA